MSAASLRSYAALLDRQALAAEDAGHLGRADSLRRQARERRRQATAAELREIGTGVAA